MVDSRYSAMEFNQLHIDYALMDNWKICHHMRMEQVDRWGFAIVRGTYNSQPQGDKFMAQLLKDIRDRNLQFEEDSLLQDTLNVPVIEDKEKLNGATWEFARHAFNEWVVKDMAAHPLALMEPRSLRQLSPREKALEHMHRTPFWTYCIFVDEASLSSMLNSTSLTNLISVSAGDH
jgi:hypothetical protein